MAVSAAVEKGSRATVKTLPVVETFHSIQGEGAWTGANAFFIRLAGCDVGCPWCDTKHSWPMDRHPVRPVRELVEAAIAARPFMVVITGGEPLTHDLGNLTTALKAAGLRVHLETSGAYPLTGVFDWIALSPKRFKAPLEEIYEFVDELKVVVGDPEDLDWAERSARKVSDKAIKLLQPRWTAGEDTHARQSRVVDYVMSHPDWRVGLQTHKFLEVR